MPRTFRTLLALPRRIMSTGAEGLCLPQLVGEMTTHRLALVSPTCRAFDIALSISESVSTQYLTHSRRVRAEDYPRARNPGTSRRDSAEHSTAQALII